MRAHLGRHPTHCITCLGLSPKRSRPNSSNLASLMGVAERSLKLPPPPLTLPASLLGERGCPPSRSRPTGRQTISARDRQSSAVEARQRRPNGWRTSPTHERVIAPQSRRPNGEFGLRRPAIKGSQICSATFQTMGSGLLRQAGPHCLNRLNRSVLKAFILPRSVDGQ